MDYETYVLSRREIWGCIGKSILVAAAGAWILYRSVFGCLTVILFLPFCIRRDKAARLAARREKLRAEFRDAMQSVAAALQAGYSLENAWRESEKEMAELHGKEALMTRELHQMNLAVGVSEPLEKLLYEFAERSGCEDIRNFAEVFLFAKKSGGDFMKIIRTTTAHISDKIEVENDIQTMLSAKRMEQKIMNAVPAFMLCYLNLTSPEFLEPLYGNPLGVCVMTAALGIYLGAVLLADKIMRIEV